MAPGEDVDTKPASEGQGEANGSKNAAPAPRVVPNLDGTEDVNTLQSRWTFWYHRRGGNSKNMDYNESIKGIGSFGTVEAYWKIYDHIVRPNDFKVTTDYHMFREGVQPTWEDPVNNEGGKWMIRLKKGIASFYWENLLLAIIGEQFEVGDEVCGAVVSVRNNEDIISVWNKNAENKEATNAIRDQMRKSLKLPSFIAIEYKKHLDAKADGSSFRNPSMVWKASGRSQDARGEGSGGPRHPKGAHRGEGGGPKSSWKPHHREARDAPLPSTGDPARDAAAAKAAAEEREKGGGGPGGGGASRTWTNRRERGPGSGGDESAFFKRAPSGPTTGMIPGPPRKTDQASKAGEGTGDVWRRGGS